MSLKIIEKNENKLLKRTEIKAEIGFSEKATESTLVLAYYSTTKAREEAKHLSPERLQNGSETLLKAEEIQIFPSYV